MARRHRRNRSHTSGMIRMKFTLATSANSVTPSATEFIDLAQCLSLASRRFYRQGYCYSVAGFEVISDSDTGTGFVHCSTVPSTWVASGAWQKSMALWIEMDRQALDIDPSIKPKFYDFKHYMDADHIAKQSAPGESDGNILPLEGFYAGQAAEWDYSKIQIPNDAVVGNTVEHVLHMVGPEIGSVSMPMIQGYADSRSVPFSPDPVTNNPSVGWMNQLFNVGDNLSEITNVLEGDNDELPYDQLGYIGGAVIAPYAQLIGEGVVTSTTVGARTRISGGLAYSGLIRIDNDLSGDTSNSVFSLVVYLVPGSYKGIDAIPMQEVN